METITLNFKASGQNLTADAHPQRYASNTVNYIQAVFDLDENWQSFDSVRAVWHNDFACISTVLDVNGACTVPHEVLTNLDEVIVNLVGSNVEGEELVDRMTTYPLRVVIIDAHARICGTETAEVTPSQFEQYVAIVSDLVHSVKDIDRIELNEDYTLTVYFSDETSWTSTSIRGEQGETGNGIASAVLNDDYTLTLNFTDGTSYTTSSIRGEQGPQGEPGEVTLAQLESVLPTDTASGAIASFPDGSDLFDYLSCIVNIEPVQAGSGTPSPDNVRPITGWTGCEVVQASRNLFNGSYDVMYKLPEPIAKGTWVTASAKTSGNTQIYYYDENRAQIDYFTLNQTDPNDSSRRYRTFQMSKYETQAVPYYIKFTSVSATDMQFELSSEDAIPTPYKAPTLYNITWQTEAGTVYGCTVDVVTGVLTVTTVMENASDLVVSMAGTSDVNKKRALITTTYQPKNVLATEVGNNLLCNVLPSKTANATYAKTEGISYGGTGKCVYAYVDSLQTVSAWETFAEDNNMVFTYELATPTTYQLTPTQIQTLLGQNNVWADCGDVEVQYKADVQRWVEKMLNA